MPRPLQLTRRRVLAAISGAASGVALPRAAQAQTLSDIRALPSLGEIAARRGLLFGSSIASDTLADPRQSELYLHHARIFTTDTALKFASLRPQEGPANFARADEIIAFAGHNKIPIRGHTLIWNDWNPEWVTKLSPSRAAYWLDRHIDEVVSRYAGRIHSWDVVNEPFWPAHGNPGGFRSGPWYDGMGSDYIVRALKRAHAADPAARICINEAGPEWETVWGPSEPYRNGLSGLVDSAQQAGVRLDCVGLQCHWFPDFTFDAGHFRAYLNALGERGVAIYLTELDVNDAQFLGTVEERDTAVAQRYAQLVEAALLEPKVEGIITWQLTDRASWLRGARQLWGPAGAPPRPLPFDDNLAPKAAYHALARVLAPLR